MFAHGNDTENAQIWTTSKSEFEPHRTNICKCLWPVLTVLL